MRTFFKEIMNITKILNLKLLPEKAGEIVRNHWSIENRLHWNRNVNFGEDASLTAIGKRLRIKVAYKILFLVSYKSPLKI